MTVDRKEYYRYIITYDNYGGLDIDGFVLYAFNPNVYVELLTFIVIKETKQGYWLLEENDFNEYIKDVFRHPYNKEYFKKQMIWTSKTKGKYKKVFPTKEEAMDNLRERNKSRIAHLERDLKVAKLAKTMINNRYITKK